MGNLNQFYFMGRVASAPEASEGEAGQVVRLAIQPGTGGRPPRSEPLAFRAYGPQAEAAKALQVGQAVLLRGQLRQEASGLEARVQAIELLAGEGRRSEGGERTRTRRRRRRRGKKGEGAEGADGSAEGPEGQTSPAGDGAGDGEPASEAPPPPKKPEPKPLPPPTPIAQAPVEPPPPDPTYKTDMPF